MVDQTVNSVVISTSDQLNESSSLMKLYCDKYQNHVEGGYVHGIIHCLIWTA